MKYLQTALISLCLIVPLLGQSKLEVADLGDFRLQNGAVIRDCRIGYRIYGQMNNDKSNIILFPTWFGGTSEDIGRVIGTGKLVDSTRYCVIAVDALGNGVSSSPSNSELQSGSKFPKFTIRDLVNSQYELLTAHLKINHLFCIIGGSMGGMQAFEWLVLYPDFMEKVVPYVSSPKTSSYDRLLIDAELLALKSAETCPDVKENVIRIVATLNVMVAYSPEYRVSKTPIEKYNLFINKYYADFESSFKPFNWKRQLQAIAHHDITFYYDGSLKKAAPAVKADVFIIVVEQDHLVNPLAAIEFSKYLKSKLLILDSACGHLGIACEMDTVSAAIQSFLNEPVN